MPLVSTLSKHKKTSGVQFFSEGIEKVHWHEMGYEDLETNIFRQNI